MWTISRKIPSASIENNVHLLVGKEYIVGRKDCPVLIKDDPSISRKHAVLVVSYDIANLGDISKVPELMLTDSSKYGSSVNGMKITQPTKLQDGDEVLFGTHGSVYRVTYTPLIAVTSCLESNKKKLLKKQIHKLGGHLINEWKTGHVNHLVMDGLVFTIKVIHALADCCHIVSPSWFDETVKAIEAQKTPPMPKMFLPPLKEETIKSDEPLFLPDQNRKTLFAGKTFYFLSSKQFKRTHEAIEMCSGQTIFLELSKGLEYDKLLVNDGSCLMMLDQKERENLPADNKECVTEIMDFLKSNKKRPIPESELGLAILEMNLTHYCNSNIDAVPAITQNIVCQSLNVGLDEMSQVYSPQDKKQASQFKKPSSLNGQTDSKPVFQSGRKDSVKTAQSTITSTLTPARSTEQQKDNKRKVSVTETPESAMKSDKPKEIQKVSPIPETMNISDDGNVFVSETPSRKSSKSDITSFFVTNKNRKEVRSDSLSFDNSNVSEKEMTAKQTGKINLQNNKKDKAIVPDSLGFEESEIESAKKNQGVAKIGRLQKDAKQPTVVPDSLRPSTSDPESPPKEAFNFLASKRDKSFKRMIPDSLGLDSETNDFNTEQTGTRKESKSEQVAIPDSMGMDESYEEDTRSEMFITASSETTGTPMKRRRMTEDEKDLEKLPVKRMKNTTGELEENDWYTNQGGKEENFIPSSDINEPGISTRTDVSSEHEIRTAQPDGFLSARVSVKPNLPAVRKPVISSDVSEEGFNEDDLPRNLIVVDVVSLVVRKPGGKKIAPVIEVRGKNFKTFKKQWYAGCDRRFPKIIGGNDLVVHQALSNLEHEDWFIEAREASQEQERRDRMEAELFMSDAGLPQRRRKAR